VPEGSILNARRPAAVNLRTRTGWYLAPNVFRALAAAAPGQVQANTGLPIAAYIHGQTPSGETYSDMLFIGGGQGASAHGDGKSGLLWPTSAANTSIELFERRVPVLVIEKTYVAGSGGRGRHRGGLGQRIRLRKLTDDGLTTMVSVYPEGVGNPTPGLFGGEAGGQAYGAVTDSAGTLLQDCGTGSLVQLTSTDQRVEIVLAGGAGYGNPADRAAHAVTEDRVNGFLEDAPLQAAAE
jgi:5-oxoprolinase (ATP-hydrolysing)